MDQVTLSEQIDRLAAVDLKALAVQGAAKKPKRQQPKQIPAINRRLEVWGEWVLSNKNRSGEVAGSSMLGALIDGGGIIVRSTDPSAGSMPDDIFDTDRAVQRLDDADQWLVREQYLNLAATPDERAEAVGCKRRMFFFRLAKVQQKILFLLKPPASLRSKAASRTNWRRCVS